MGKKILLADDSITIQKVIELTFSDEDFEVTTVGNGRLAIERAQEIRPDIILCDIIMPEKDGYDVCDFVKKHASLSHVPVLLLTGAFEPFDQERAARVGCDGFLAKPFEPQTLIAKVKDLLSQSASRSAPAAPPRQAAPPPPLSPPPPLEAPTTVRVMPATAMPPPSPIVVAPTPPPLPAPPPRIETVSAGMFIPDEPLVEEPAPPSVEVSEMFEEAPSPVYRPAPAYEPAPIYEPAPLFEPAPVVEPQQAPEALVESTPIEPFDAAAPVEEAELYAVDEVVEVVQEAPAQPVASAAEPLVSESPVDTVFFRSAGVGWSQPTVEVPLEERAQASVESAQAAAAAEPVFEEVFDELHDAPTAELPAAPEVKAPPPPPRAAEPEAPAPEPVVHEESFADMSPLPPVEAAAAARGANAAEVAVPVDMVSQIAQRVVAQISEKVIREIAWEVIPELAESLIKKEIERLKAELQQS